MTRQVTVRLPEDLVAFIDRRVASGDATSRAAVVGAAVERERRREIAERDAMILAASGPDDLDDLARYGESVPFDDLA
jgi:Arc/MetJ-type ribon-helix-helix transcriptional regulator